jgi:hypothetical protein
MHVTVSIETQSLKATETTEEQKQSHAALLFLWLLWVGSQVFPLCWSVVSRSEVSITLLSSCQSILSGIGGTQCLSWKCIIFITTWTLVHSSSLTSVHFRSLMWVGPSLLYSTATSVLVLGWDGIARPLVTIGTPNAGKSYTSHSSVDVSSFNNISTHLVSMICDTHLRDLEKLQSTGVASCILQLWWGPWMTGCCWHALMTPTQDRSRV